MSSSFINLPHTSPEQTLLHLISAHRLFLQILDIKILKENADVGFIKETLQHSGFRFIHMMFNLSPLPGSVVHIIYGINAKYQMSSG